MTKLKNLFSTPIKAAVTVACMLVIVALVGTAVVFIGRAAAGADAIGSDKAQMFAFADAGVDPTSAERVHTEFDYENGEFVYDIEFVAGGKEYEYRIKANDGAIISRSSELMDGQQNTGAVTGNTDVQPQGSDDSNVITADEARAAALADAGLSESEVTFTKTQLDRDDGVQEYEVDFYTSDKEYDYEINAITGEIISRESETFKNNSSAQQNQTSGDVITAEEARAAALADAGLSESEVTFTKTQLDRDDGVQEYEVDFYTSDKEYDYEINAITGEIISRESETFKNNSSAQQTQTSGDVITADEARAAALADAGLSESEVTFTKTQLDRDDGVQVYEIEFYTSDRECEYEINATTGKVISRSSETYRTQSQNPGNASYIGVDKAKEIAAGHAGISLSGATFSKAKLERDDGYMVYEIEFYSGGIEYEYTIDAVTGDIIEYDSEHH